MSAQNVVLPLNNAFANSSPAGLERLVSDCSPAIFGRGKRDVLDPYADFGIIILIEKFCRNGSTSKPIKWAMRNCTFPPFVTENVLHKEQNHIDGFAPEVA
jgi:hypothetical protein